MFLTDAVDCLTVIDEYYKSLSMHLYRFLDENLYSYQHVGSTSAASEPACSSGSSYSIFSLIRFSNLMRSTLLA